MNIDDFFNNIPEVDESFTYMPDKIAIELARQLNTNKNSSSNEENIDDENSINESETVFLVESIETENIEHETKKEIPQISNNSILIPCAIIDHIDGDIKKCGSTNKLRGLWQLVGTWELDTDTVIQAKKQLENLGVCYNHFMFDQNKLHSKGVKKNKDISQSLINYKRCLYCGKNYYVFSRGKICSEHSWSLIGKNLQVACVGQKTCPALQVFNSIII